MATQQTWALVTGAARGIGRSIVERLTGDGSNVIGLDIDAEGLERLLPDRSGKNLVTCTFDLGKIDEIPALVQGLLEDHGPINALVNNAAIFTGGPIVEMSATTWNGVLAVNLGAPFALMRQLAPVMAAAGNGAIVNIASRNAFRSSTNNAAYDVSKAGLVALTRTAAGEFASSNIRVNAVCPGVVATPGETALDNALFNAAYRKQIPLDRYAYPEEIAAAVRFFLSDEAAYITGQTLVVDGGQLACQDNRRFMEIPGLG